MKKSSIAIAGFSVLALTTTLVVAQNSAPGGQPTPPSKSQDSTYPAPSSGAGTSNSTTSTQSGNLSTPPGGNTTPTSPYNQTPMNPGPGTPTSPYNQTPRPPGATSTPSPYPSYVTPIVPGSN